MLDKNGLVVVISQSGETADSLAALREAKEIVTADIFVDNQEIIADGVGELKEYMDEVVPQRPNNFNEKERVLITVILMLLLLLTA